MDALDALIRAEAILAKKYGGDHVHPCMVYPDDVWVAVETNDKLADIIEYLGDWVHPVSVWGTCAVTRVNMSDGWALEKFRPRRG